MKTNPSLLNSTKIILLLFCVTSCLMVHSIHADALDRAIDYDENEDEGGGYIPWSPKPLPPKEIPQSQGVDMNTAKPTTGDYAGGGTGKPGEYQPAHWQFADGTGNPPPGQQPGGGGGSPGDQQRNNDAQNGSVTVPQGYGPPPGGSQGGGNAIGGPPQGANTTLDNEPIDPCAGPVAPSLSPETQAAIANGEMSFEEALQAGMAQNVGASALGNDMGGPCAQNVTAFYNMYGLFSGNRGYATSNLIGNNAQGGAHTGNYIDAGLMTVVDVGIPSRTSSDPQAIADALVPQMGVGDLIYHDGYNYSEAGGTGGHVAIYAGTWNLETNQPDPNGTPMIYHCSAEGYPVLTPVANYFSSQYWFHGWDTQIYHWTGDPPIVGDGEVNPSLIRSRSC